MTSSTQTKSIHMRRIVWLSIFAVMIGLIYSGVWYYSAQMLDERVHVSLARLNGDGVRANCEEPSIQGYPFRLGVQCRSVFYEDVKEGVSFRAGKIETTAAIYDPKHVMMTVESPATVFLPFVAPIDLRWETLNVSSQLASSFPSRISAAGKNIEILGDENNNRLLATIDAGTLHARQADQAVEVAGTFNELKVHPGSEANLPLLEGRAMVIVYDGVAMLGERKLNLRGRKGEIEEFVVGVTGQKASVSLEGPVEFDNDGFLTAQLTFRTEDPVGTAKVLADIFPDSADHIRSATGILTAMGNTAVELRIARGDVFIGFIPIGKIPPI